VLRRERWRTAYLLGVTPLAVLRRCRLAPTGWVKRSFMNFLWGLKREEVQKIAREFAETDVKRWVYPELKAVIEEHRAAGRMLILNTASPDFYPHEIARVLGFDHCVATRVEPTAVMPFMPQVIGENNKREEKIRRMREEIPAVAAAGEAELRESWSYSDSKADLPLLEFAGNAVLIHPNAELEAIGKERRWKVLRPKRPYQSKVGDMWCVARQALGVF
jgi:HAD superfamily hydrolase (TIGR01490 family)